MPGMMLTVRDDLFMSLQMRASKVHEATPTKSPPHLGRRASLVKRIAMVTAVTLQQLYCTLHPCTDQVSLIYVTTPTSQI